jgi:outer membrane biosynthesis protein TonB
VPFPSKKTPPFPRRSPKPEKAVVRSPVPQTTPGKTRAPRPAQETQADTRSPDASTLKKQIRLALADLAAGRHRKAERRLRGALAG